MRTYQAFGFHPQFGGRTIAGTLTIEGQRVLFQHESGVVEAPLDGLTLRAGGHNSEQIFLEHPKLSGWSIYTAERAILDEQAFAATSLARSPRRTRNTRVPTALVVLAAIFLILVVGLVVLLFTQRGKLVRLLADQVPLAWEQKFGDELFEQIKKQGTIVDDPILNRRVRAVTSRLVPTIGKSAYDFRFHIVADTNINAFALPGGHVVIYRGLLATASSGEELAGVLAHEMAHVTERHGFRKIIESAGLYLVVQSLFGDASGVLAAIANSSEFLLRQKYSRDFEREADDVGWDYLLAANIDPRGMVEFFKKLKSHDERATQISSFLSTHPTSAERIERLENRLKRLPKTRSFVPVAVELRDRERLE